MSVAVKVSVTGALCQWWSAPLTVVVGGVVSVQPPVVVARMVPSLPATQPCLASGKATHQRFCVVPGSCCFQVTPPFVVATMTADVVKFPLQS